MNNDKAFWKKGKGSFGKSNTPVKEEDILLFSKVKSTAELINNGDKGNNPFISAVDLLDPSGTGIVSGGRIVWISGYKYEVPKYVYGIKGDIYSFEKIEKTLEAASNTVDENRIDVFVGTFDSEGNGLVEVIKGQYALNPVKPTVNPETQIELSFVRVDAQTTAPVDVSNLVFYDENTESTITDIIATGTVNYDSTSTPFSSAKCIEAVDFASGDEMKFVKGAVFKPSDYDSFQMYVKPTSGLWDNNGSIKVGFFNGATKVSNYITINSVVGAGTYFDSTLAEWQNIAIDVYSFKFSQDSADTIKIIKDDGKGSVDFKLDLIRLQEGVVSAKVPVIVTSTAQILNEGANKSSQYTEDKDLAVVAKSGSYNDLLDKPNVKSVENEYATIAALLADQANQSDNAFQSVIDASGDPSVGGGYAYYEYLGTVLGTMADYRKLSEEESVDLIVITNTAQLTNNGADATSTYVEHDELGAVALSNDYEDLDNTPIFKVVENQYANMAALYADQVNQQNTFIQFVTDASAHSLIVSGSAYFEYLGTTLGSEADYRLLSDAESAPIAGAKTKTSELINDGEFGTDTYVEQDNLDTLLTSKANKILGIKVITGTAYTLIADDILMQLVYEGTAPMIITIPNNATLDLPIGTVFYAVGTNTGTVTIAGGAGVVFQTAVGLVGGQNEVRKYTKRYVNTWGIEGSVVSSADMILANVQEVSGLKTFLYDKLGLRNAANTFTSFFRNANTAVRYYTLPNKDGTVAMTSDIVAQMSGVVNYLVKFGTATTGVVSRLWDTGTFLGIGTVESPLKDIALGYQSDREIGVELSTSSIKGRDLIISAGKTINYILNSSFLKLSTPSGGWFGLGASINNNIYSSNNNQIYMQTNGIGAFNAINQSLSGVADFSGHPNGDMYAVTTSAVYKRVADTGNFVLVVTLVTTIRSIACHPNGNIYVCMQGGDIYMQTNATGDFVALGQVSRSWQGLACHSNGNVYATCHTGDIYMQTNGVGNFVGLGQTSRSWGHISCSPTNGNVYAVSTNIQLAPEPTDKLYMQTNGIGIFNEVTSFTIRGHRGVEVAPNGNVYVCAYNTLEGIYMQDNNALGIADLDGGTLINKAGTGKGTGKSRYQIVTGQKTVSGTDMQLETVRAEFDEDGNYKRIGTPVYADNASALAGGLTAGMEYRTATGVKMEVY